MFQSLMVYLISPSGTISPLLKQPGIHPIKGTFVNEGASAFSGAKSLGSTNFRGENAEGEWQVVIEPKAPREIPSDVKIENALGELRLILFGKENDFPTQLIYTDELLDTLALRKDKSEHNIPESNKAATLNLAAFSSSTKIDFAQDNTLTLGETSIKVENPNNIHIIIAGKGDTKIITGKHAMIIVPGEGHDQIKIDPQGEHKILFYRKFDKYIGDDKILGFRKEIDKIILGPDACSNVGNVNIQRDCSSNCVI